MSFDLIGAGPGGGGGPRNVPDNLRSVDSYEAVIGLGTSRMTLAPGGLKNLFINNVQVEDSQGNANFTEFTAALFDGDPTILQPINLTLGQSAGGVGVSLTLSNDYENGSPGDWVTAAITTPGCDFIDVRFAVNALYNQTKDGIKEETATIEVEVRPSGSTNWINPLVDMTAPAFDENGINDTLFQRVWYLLRNKWSNATTWAGGTPGLLKIKGKTTSTYFRELRIGVPNTGAYANKTWQVRARLIERDYQLYGDENENERRRSIVWESVAGVNSKPIGGTEEWRGLSHLQIYGKATDQINGVPEITGIYDIGRYLVPPSTVWDPITRLYTGAAWDGITTQLAWTQCPAWQIKGLIEDDLSGVSALTPGSTLNKWDVLEASKWFSTLVPDGFGGMHPRYSANWFIEEGQQAHELVNYLAGAVGAFCWDEGDGNWRMKVEKPENPVMIFTKENIVGEFSYAHTDFDTRYNDYTGVFRNKDLLYKEDRVRVFDQTDIDLTGRRHTTVALVGCDNRQEALRRLKIRQLSSQNEFRIVNFTTNRQGLMLEPFSVVAVADGDLNVDAGIRSTGRITGINLARTSITVRDPLRLEVGVNYSIRLTVPNPDYDPNANIQPSSADWRKPTITITRNIVNTAAQRGDVVNLHLDQALPANVPEFAPISLEAVGLPALPKQYRVTNIKPDDSNPELVSITAIEIYTSKWAESDNITEDEILAQSTNRVAPSPIAPAAGMFSLQSFNSDSGVNRVLTVSWERPASLFIRGYRVEYQHNGGPWMSFPVTTERYIEMQNPEHGVYNFRIYTVDRRGIESLPLEGTYGVPDLATQGTPVGYLTRGSVVLAAASDGTVSDYSPASGQFVLALGSGTITSGVVYSIVGTPTGGITAFIDPDTGAYSVTNMTQDQGQVTFQAVYGDITITLTFSLAKAVRGQDGEAAAEGPPGTSNAIVYIYKRATSVPTLPTVPAVYTFSTKTLSGLNNGWSTNIPVGGDPIYIAAATASSATDTDTIGSSEWSAPVQWTQNGVSAATVYLFQRTTTATPPLRPINDITYTFATGEVTGITNGWSTTMPTTGGGFRWMTTATALGTGPTELIPASEWAEVALLSRDGDPGAPGAPGTNGVNNAVVYIYKRSTTQPALPTQTTSYTFSTGGLTNLDNGWTRTIPAGTDPLYVSVANVNSTTDTDTIAANEWATPVILVQNGSNGVNTATVYLYQRTTTPTPPAAPSSNSTYTFSNGQLGGYNNGWSTTLPTTGGGYRWITMATALSSGNSDTIEPNDWSPVTLIAQDGTSGGYSVVIYIYQRAATQPTLPVANASYNFTTGALTGLTNGWSATIPGGSADLWVSAATVVATTETDTVTPGEWAAPVVLARNGVDGAPGINMATVYLFQRTASATPPALPSADATFTFASNTLTGVTNGWSRSMPTTGGAYRWMTMATAFNTGASDTIPASEWAAAALIGQDGTNGSDGAPGQNAISVSVTKAAIALWAYADGTIADMSGASGSVVVMNGSTNVTGQATYSISATPGITASITTSGDYSVSVMQPDTGFLNITVNYGGVIYTRVVSLAKARAGYEIVSSLPVSNLFVGRMVFLTSNNKLYRYTSSGWTSAVDAGDLTGQIPGTRIEDGGITTPKLAANSIIADHLQAGIVDAAKLASSELITLSAQIKDGLIGTAKIGDLAVDTAKIANLSVDTIKVKNNAITTPVNAYTSGTTSGTGNVQSLSISTAGGPVKIDVAVGYDYNAATGSFMFVDFTFSVYRGGSRIYGPVKVQELIDSGGTYPKAGGTFNATIIDNPSAGNWSYSVSIDSVSHSWWRFFSRAMTALELKK